MLSSATYFGWLFLGDAGSELIAIPDGRALAVYDAVAGALSVAILGTGIAQRSLTSQLSGALGWASATGGWALCAEGLVQENPLLAATGTVIGVSGAVSAQKLSSSSWTRVLLPWTHPVGSGVTDGSSLQTDVRALRVSRKVQVIIGDGIVDENLKACAALCSLISKLRATGITVECKAMPSQYMPGYLQWLMARTGVDCGIASDDIRMTDDVDSQLLVGIETLRDAYRIVTRTGATNDTNNGRLADLLRAII